MNFGDNFLAGIQAATNTAGGAIIGSLGDKLSGLIGGSQPQGGNVTAAQIAAGQSGSPPQPVIPGFSGGLDSIASQPWMKYAIFGVIGYAAFKFLKKRG